MKIFDKWLDKKIEERTFNIANSFMPYANESETVVNGNTAMYVPPYASAVHLLSSSLAKLSVHVMKGNKRAEGHMLERLFEEPNEFMDGYSLIQQSEMQRMNEGNAYIHIQREGNKVVRLMPINHTYVTPHVEGNRYFYRVKNGKNTIDVSVDDMIHVKSPFAQDYFKGLGYPYILKEQLGLWLNAQKHQSRYFAVGSNPTSVIEVDSKLSAEAKEKVREQWEKLNVNNGNKHKAAILDAGMRFHNLGANFNDLQMNDIFNELAIGIAATFNISPSLIGREGSKNTYQNVESQSIAFLQQGLMPSIKVWEAQLNKVLGDDEYKVRFNYETLLRADSKSRAERLKLLVESGIMKVDEARGYEGL